MANIEVDSPNVTYGDRYIEADYEYCTTRVEPMAGGRFKVCQVRFLSDERNFVEHARGFSLL